MSRLEGGTGRLPAAKISADSGYSLKRNQEDASFTLSQKASTPAPGKPAIAPYRKGYKPPRTMEYNFGQDGPQGAVHAIYGNYR